MMDIDLDNAFLGLRQSLDKGTSERHPLETGDCPPLARFALASDDWSAAEQAHMGSCPYCTRMLRLAKETPELSGDAPAFLFAVRLRWDAVKGWLEAATESVRQMVAPDTPFVGGFRPANRAEAVATMGAATDTAVGAAFADSGDSFWLLVDGETGRLKARSDSDAPPLLGRLSGQGDLHLLAGEWVDTDEGWQMDLGAPQDVDGTLVALAANDQG